MHTNQQERKRLRGGRWLGLALALTGCGMERGEESESPGTQQQGLTTLTATEDAYVHETNAASNYGSSTSLFVKNDAGASRYAYLKFKLTGISGVTSAKLRVHGSASAATTLQAFQTADGWTEAALTWSNKPAPGSLVGGVALTTADQDYEIDVTAYVNAQAAGDGTVSFVLQEVVGKYTTLVSSEGSANPPRLDVTLSGGGTGDTQAPTVPANLTATAVSSSQVNLGWSASSDNVGVTGYALHRDNVFLKNVSGTSTSDTGLAASTTYSYSVRALDAAGNSSGNSATVTATTSSGGGTSCTNALASTASIQTALKNAAPGAVILLAPGTYTGNRGTSGDPGGQGLFYSGKSGTATSPIILKSCDPANPATLTGTSVKDGSYGLHLTGDFWQVRDLRVTTAQKGIIVDNGNHNLLSGVEVHTVGDEAVHFRDGSSYNTLEASRIHDTGKYQPQYGEGAYVGSDSSNPYEHVVIGNVIRTTVFAGGITAEHIDIKEGADGTLVEGCTFNGAGISGENSADSFVDVKGVNTVVRDNRGFRQGNAKVLDAFQVRTHGSDYATGENNAFSGNVVDLDDSPGYVVYATSAATGTTAHDDVRTGGGNLYNGNVNE
ncbi:CBM96 family carbohydrate-binding protein [Corallococcus llansteffanensis]|uniref:DNRLRE domain-containing protein n=1 Tax=Corallococcus llansteffanensis TaxID=2316731 RepID=A0A3A8Q9T9_9BACT|nr:DNRLRE domain-containing protein [Corallococcus llansteffanensis]RKH65443.1 DNRLRE domain-containing protein [Corallococcus llansteffanensis]